MSHWSTASRNRCSSLIVILVEWCNIPSLSSHPRRQPVARESAAAQAKKRTQLDCGVWPPRRFSRITDLYQLKIEYDCRNQTIALQRRNLAGQEAIQSTTLAEKRDRKGLIEKDKWAQGEQDKIDAHQRELDKWRDEELKRLDSALQSSPADPGPGGPEVAAASK